MLLHPIHYASLEKVSKKNYDKQFITVTTYKNVQNYYNYVKLYTGISICTKNMELYSKETTLFLKDQGGGTQHCLIPFVGSNLKVETFLKKMEHQKSMRHNRGLRHLCILCIEVSRKFYVKPVDFSIVFF